MKGALVEAHSVLYLREVGKDAAQSTPFRCTKVAGRESISCELAQFVAVS